MIKLELTGIDKVLKDFDNKSAQLVKEVDTEMAAYCFKVNDIQKTLVPVDKGLLRSSLQVKKEGTLDYNIRSTGLGSSYAPYQEFGTGGLVSIPAGLEDEARQFKGAGIRKVNMKAQPFFYAPAYELWGKFIEKVKDILKR